MLLHWHCGRILRGARQSLRHRRSTTVEISQQALDLNQQVFGIWLWVNSPKYGNNGLDPSPYSSVTNFEASTSDILIYFEQLWIEPCCVDEHGWFLLSYMCVIIICIVLPTYHSWNYPSWVEKLGQPLLGRLVVYVFLTKEILNVSKRVFKQFHLNPPEVGL